MLKKRENKLNLGEFSSDIKLYLHEKASSPFWIPFIVSWLAWNHRFVLVLISDINVKEKFEIIDKILYPSVEFFSVQTLFIFSKTIFFPLCTSLSITLILPYFLKWLYEKHGEHQNAMKEVQNKVNGQRPITENEKKELLLKLHIQEGKYKESISSFTKEIDELKSTIEKLTSKTREEQDENGVEVIGDVNNIHEIQKDFELNNYGEKNEIKNNINMLDRLSDSDKEICYKILGSIVKNNSSVVKIDNVALANGISLQKSLFLKDMLEELGLVTFRNNFLTLTSEGRSYMYDNGLL